jgi:hypothetical protein
MGSTDKKILLVEHQVCLSDISQTTNIFLGVSIFGI